MVIFLVTQCDALSLEFFQPLTIDLNAAGTGLRQRVVLEDPSHVMEQSGNTQKYIGRQIAVLPVQQCISIGVALVCRFGQPVNAHISIVLHTLSHKIHFAEHVLGVLVSVLCGLFEPSRRRCVAVRYVVAFVVLLSQTVGGIIVAVLNAILVRSGRDDYALITILAGIVAVLMMLLPQFADLLSTVKRLMDI